MKIGLLYPLTVAAWALVLLVNFTFCQDLECTDDHNDIQVDVNSPGSISSPNYPAPYPIIFQCKWKLTAPDGSRIKLTIKGVDFGDNDFVTLLDGLEDDSPEIATYTKCAGGELQLFSSGRRVLIWFVSDDSAPGKGFTLDYQAVPSDKITCIPKSPDSYPIYRDPDGMFGVVRHPESPRGTSPLAFGTWTIEVPTDNRILLTFYWFGFAAKRRRRCSDDLVRTRAVGGTVSDFCGCDLPPKQILNTEKAYLEMSTWRGGYPGMTVSYRALGPHECNEGAASCPPNVRAIGTNRDGGYCYDTVLDEVGGEITLNITGKLQIVCDKYIQVSVRREDYPGLAPYTVHLEDPSCKPTFINNSIVIFKFGPEDCKTEQEEDGENIHYSNVIYAVVDLPTNDSAITRKHKTVLPFKCSYEKKAVVSKVSYSPRVAQVVTRTADYGNFTYFMDMYTTKEYDEKVDEYPVEVGLGQPLFLEGRVESGDKDLLVFLEMCKATLTSNYNDKPDHMIIENSCPRDNTLEYNYTMSAIQRFSLAAFRFQKGYDDVVIHCKLTVCRKEDSESRCVKGCETEGNGARKRRSPDQDYSVTLYIGPVSIMESMESAPDPVQTEEAAANEESGSLLAIIAAIVGILAVLAVGLIIALIVIFKRRRASDKGSILVVHDDEEH